MVEGDHSRSAIQRGGRAGPIRAPDCGDQELERGHLQSVATHIRRGQELSEAPDAPLSCSSRKERLKTRGERFGSGQEAGAEPVSALRGVETLQGEFAFDERKKRAVCEERMTESDEAPQRPKLPPGAVRREQPQERFHRQTGHIRQFRALQGRDGPA